MTIWTDIRKAREAKVVSSLDFFKNDCPPRLEPLNSAHSVDMFETNSRRKSSFTRFLNWVTAATSHMPNLWLDSFAKHGCSYHGIWNHEHHDESNPR